MTPFTLTEIELLLSALDTWEATAQREIATQVNKDVTDEALQMVSKDTSEEEQQELVARLTKRSMAQYTPEVVRRLVRERNEPSVLLKARLILMKRDIEQQIADGVYAEMFSKKEGDESESTVQ